MASDFESYIQIEIPKRPFMETDAELESVIVRRGQGPRQLQGVKINEGEALGMRDGQLVSMQIKGAVSQIHLQNDPSKHWTIVNAQDSVNVTVTVYDTNGKVIIADDVVVTADQIDVFFNEAQAGRAVFIFA